MANTPAIATLMFYDRSIFDRIRGRGITPPVDKISIAIDGQEYKEVRSPWRIIDYVRFELVNLHFRDVAADLAVKLGTKDHAWNYSYGKYDVLIPQSQRPTIIPAFVNYFSKNSKF